MRERADATLPFDRDATLPFDRDATLPFDRSLLKDMPPADPLAGIRVVAAGRALLPPR